MLPLPLPLPLRLRLLVAHDVRVDPAVARRVQRVDAPVARGVVAHGLAVAVAVQVDARAAACVIPATRQGQGSAWPEW